MWLFLPFIFVRPADHRVSESVIVAVDHKAQLYIANPFLLVYAMTFNMGVAIQKNIPDYVATSEAGKEIPADLSKMQIVRTRNRGLHTGGAEVTAKSAPITEC